jgi:hypothetical protein
VAKPLRAGPRHGYARDYGAALRHTEIPFSLFIHEKRPKKRLFSRRQPQPTPLPQISLITHNPQSSMKAYPLICSKIGLRCERVPKDTWSSHSLPPIVMLAKNRLQPPRAASLLPPVAEGLPLPTQHAPEADAWPVGEGFVSAEDFDSTGLFTGVDPCASSYWWMPDLQVDALPLQPATGTIAAGGSVRAEPRLVLAQATSRSGSRTPAAA